jgi:hypothetical protein
VGIAGIEPMTKRTQVYFLSGHRIMIDFFLSLNGSFTCRVFSTPNNFCSVQILNNCAAYTQVKPGQVQAELSSTFISL